MESLRATSMLDHNWPESWLICINFLLIDNQKDCILNWSFVTESFKPIVMILHTLRPGNFLDSASMSLS